MANSSVIVKEGFLTKSPPQEKLMANWHKRFFVLWSSGAMEYYSTSNKKPQDYLKTLDLNSCEDMIAPFPVGARTYVIKIAINNKGKNRDYLFDCDSEIMMEEWVSCLASVCGFAAVEGEDEDENEAQQNYFEVPSSGPTRQRSLSPVPVLSRPALRPPLPPPNSAPQDLYEDPNEVEMFTGDGFDNDEDLYDSNMSDALIETLNRAPPPVWKPPVNDAPPPLPNRPRKFTRSMERQHSASFSDFGPPPPLPYRIPPANSGKPHSNSVSPGLAHNKKKDKKQKPLPPPKTRSKTPPVNLQANLMDMLKKRANTVSVSEEDRPYEDLEYGEEPRNGDSSDSDGYVDCDPQQPQDYMDYKHASEFIREPSPSREQPLPLPPRNPSPSYPKTRSPLPPRNPSPSYPKTRSPLPTPPPRFSPEEDDDDDEAPPVPRRHPNASGRSILQPPAVNNLSRSASPSNTLALPPRARSISPDDDAPPVPIRDNSRPSLNRPHTDNKSVRGVPPMPQRQSLPSPDDDIFDDVSFGRGPAPLPNSRKPKPVSKGPNDSRDSRFDKPFPIPKKSDLPPRPAVKRTHREVSPKPAPPPVSSKPKPRVGSPPPKTVKPGPSDFSNVMKFSKQIQDSLEPRSKMASPPQSPRPAQKYPFPQKVEPRSTQGDSIHHHRPPSVAAKPPVKNGPPTPAKKPTATPKFNGPPLPVNKPPPFQSNAGPPVMAKKPSVSHNGVETKKKPPPTLVPKPGNKPEIVKPKLKPVISRFENTENVTASNGSNRTRPTPPSKPKPMLPPGFRP